MDDILTHVEAEESTRRSGRKSARNSQVEVITRGARRRWSEEQKRKIVAESLGRDLTPSDVARKHGIGTGQLYTWRRQLLSLQTSMVVRSAPSFAKVELTSPSLQQSEADMQPATAPSSIPLMVPRAEELIEIVMPDGRIVRMGAGVDADALRRVLDVLERR
jgi:transposase